ncbi:MAG TPA: TonB-dependent receptor [Thermoanaerobaculia bacterium]|nr:TonB-dependent receptor [Thermoanaerobaculia bacterium]
MNLLAILLFLATPQVAPPLPDQIVVTASALPETVESTPAAVTVVTKNDIDEREARDVADVLRDVPGLTVSRTGSSGHATSLFTRGAASTHTLVMWNGIEINNPYFSGYDWGRFSTAGVEQVEVVRGPYSSLYGSEAVAGVVNVITNPKKSGVDGVVEAGGHGLRNGSVTGSLVGASQLVSGALERRQDDGFSANDDFAQTSANALWKWTARPNFSIGLAGRYTSYDLGIPTNLSADLTALVPSLLRRQSGTERQFALPLSQTLGAFSYDLTISESRNNDRFSDPEDPFGTVSSQTTSTTHRARLATRTSTCLFGTFVAGAEWARAEVTDVNNFGANLDHNRRTEKSLFAEDRFSHSLGNERLEVSAGARYDDFDTFGSQVSPRLAAALISGANKFRAAFGEAFRAPSVGELYFPFSGNRDLNPERSRSAEAGYDYTFASGSQISATVFRSTYRDLITFDNATFAFANIGRASAQGVELGASHNLGAMYGSFSYTWLDKPLPRRPRNSGSIFVGYRAAGVDTNIEIARTGARADVLPVLPFNAITDRAYTTVDINVQSHLDRVTPFVKLENATGKRYDTVAGYPSPGRRAVVGVRFGM